jgi:Cu/Ag efflux protein CusF
MKTSRLCNWTVVCLSGLTATTAFRASADQATTAAKQEKTYTGTVVAADPREHVLKVKGWLLDKSFSLGDACTYTFLDNRLATAYDLHPGQKVTVRYQNASGVLVADRVEQQAMRFAGTVKAIDLQKHLLKVHVRGADKTFQLSRDCRVVLRNDKPGTLADVQPGHHVTVTYEIPNEMPTAREIAQTSATFTGTLTAIDLTERTVKAKAVLGSEKFHLADGCAIVLNGKTDAELRDLKPGDKLTFSYEEVNGINVANRIANATGSPEATTAESSK